jgi:hypothetical protein
VLKAVHCLCCHSLGVTGGRGGQLELDLGFFDQSSTAANLKNILGEEKYPPSIVENIAMKLNRTNLVA